MPLCPIRAPIATSAPQAGIRSEMKAKDSPKARAKTIGTAQPPLLWTKWTTFWAMPGRSIGRVAQYFVGRVYPDTGECASALIRKLWLILWEEVVDHDHS